MPRQYFVNNFSTALTADCSAVATSIWIAAGQAQVLYDAMAGTGDYVLLTLYSVTNGNTEVVKVDRLGLLHSVGVTTGEMDTTQGVSSRAFEGISGVAAVAKAFVSGDVIALRPTAAMLTALAASEADAAASAAAALASETAAGLSETAAGTSETNAAASEAAAAASANNKGAWSLLTGALAPPATVAHGGSFWVLLQSLANVTTVEPGTNAAYWQEVGSAANLVTLDAVQTLTNKTLTSPELGGTPVLNLGAITSSGDLPVAQGGTGASTAPDARAALGVVTTIHGGEATSPVVAVGGSINVGISGHSGDAQVSFPVGVDGTITEFRFKAGANLFSEDATVRLIKNGSAAMAPMTIPAGSTSVVTVTGLATAIAKGNTLSILINGPASGIGNMGFVTWSCVIA